MWKATSMVWCCAALVAQQGAADPVGHDVLLSLPSLLRRMDEGAALGPQLRRLGPVAQAAALGLWVLSPQPARVQDFVEVFADAGPAGQPDGDARMRIGELLAADDALLVALGAERVVPIRWVGAGRLDPVRRDELLEQLRVGPAAMRVGVACALIDGSEADALLAYEWLLALETEPAERAQARDLQRLLHSLFALRSGLDGDAPAGRTLRRQVLCGRLADPATLPPLGELDGEQLRLLALDCLGDPSRSRPNALRPWPTLQALRSRIDVAGVGRTMALVEQVRRDRDGLEVQRWAPVLQQLWLAPNASAVPPASELAAAPPTFWTTWLPAMLERRECEPVVAATLRRAIDELRREAPPAAMRSFLPDLAADEDLRHLVAALLPSYAAEGVAAELRAARLDPVRQCRWMDLLHTTTGNAQKLLSPLIPLLAGDVTSWPPEVQASYVLFGAEARVPVACWPAMLAAADVGARRRAAQAAWRHHAASGPSMSVIAAALRDQDDEVVQHAASWFVPRRDMVVDRDAAICELLAACDTAPAGGRARMLGVLGLLDARGEAVEAAARRALAAEAPRVKVEAAGLLLRQAPADEARQRSLGALLECDDLAARRDALFAAGNLDEAALPFVEIACRQLRCPDEGVAAAAARLLSRIPSIAAVARVELEKRRAEVGERSSLGRRLSGYLEVVARH